MEIQIDLPPSIINNISNADSKNNSSEAQDLTMPSKEFLASNNGATVAAVAIDTDNEMRDDNGAEHKIKQLLDGSEATLLCHAIGDKIDEKKTDFFTATDIGSAIDATPQCTAVDIIVDNSKPIADNQPILPTEAGRTTELLVSTNE